MPIPSKKIAFLIAAVITWLTSTIAPPPPQPALGPINTNPALAGNSTVGKSSSLLFQFCGKEIENYGPPTGAVKLLVVGKLEKRDSREVRTEEGAKVVARITSPHQDGNHTGTG